MKLIIAGGRDLYITSDFISESLKLHGLENITEIVSGGATGVDTAGENFALTVNIPFKRFPADWNLHGKAAGPIRNRQMAEYADALLLIWDGESRGSSNMKGQIVMMGKPIAEVVIKRSCVKS